MKNPRQSGIRRWFTTAMIPVAILSIGTIASSAEGPAARVPWTSSKLVGTPDPPPPYSVEPAFPRLKFEYPVALVRAKGTDRLFAGEVRGRISSFPNDTKVTKADLAIDLAKVHPELSALYGLTFHPRFEENRYVYVCYVLKNDVEDGSVVSRFEASRTDPPVLDPSSEKVLVRFYSGGHNGGCLDFGTDGYLYISTGDAGDAAPPDERKKTGQDCSDLLSSILRIDVDHPEPDKPYGIPSDNPFLKTSGVRPEIWAFGFRNPWRMSIDRATGDLWVGDVGWELWEMIHKVKRGGNYGWSAMEGPQPVHVDWKRGPGPILPPMIAHPHSEAASITGGYVYHGTRLPELAGAYIYGDYQTGTVWGLRSTGDQVTWQQELARSPLHLVAFGESQDGELFLIDHDRTHQIYRLIPNPAAKAKDNFPRRLSETGLFDSTRDHRPATESYPMESIPSSGQTARPPSGSWRSPATAGSASMPRETGASRRDPSSREPSPSGPKIGSRATAVGSNPRSFTSRRVPGVPIPTSGTRDSPMPSWPMPRERHEPYRSTTRPRRPGTENGPIAFTRDRSASYATTRGSRRKRRYSALNPPLRSGPIRPR